MMDKIRCGDVVLHRPSAKYWLVAYADYETGDLSWSGWPEGVARIEDCELVRKATDEQFLAHVVAVMSSSGAKAEVVHRLYVSDYFGSLVAKARSAAATASVKYPQPNYVALKIAEEAGEVVRGAVHYAEGRMEWPEVEGEIVQLLAMLIRFVSEGDQVIGAVPPHKKG